MVNDIKDYSFYKQNELDRVTNEFDVAKKI